MTDYYYIKPIFMSSISLHDQLIQFNSIRYIKQNLTKVKVYLVSMPAQTGRAIRFAGKGRQNFGKSSWAKIFKIYG